MATQALIDQFNQELNQSKNFQFLKPEQQAELRNNFATATDEQFLAAIEELKRNAQEVAANEEREKKRIALAEELTMEMKNVKKEELKKDEENDIAASLKSADDLIASLKTIASPGKKRKKFLGIF